MREVAVLKKKKSFGKLSLSYSYLSLIEQRANYAKAVHIYAFSPFKVANKSILSTLTVQPLTGWNRLA